jgi:hypothetical protein
MIRPLKSISHALHQRLTSAEFLLNPNHNPLMSQYSGAISRQVIHWRMRTLLITTQACAYSPPDAVVLGPVPVFPDGLLLFQA